LSTAETPMINMPEEQFVPSTAAKCLQHDAKSFSLSLKRKNASLLLTHSMLVKSHYDVF